MDIGHVTKLDNDYWLKHGIVWGLNAIYVAKNCMFYCLRMLKMLIAELSYIFSLYFIGNAEAF